MVYLIHFDRPYRHARHYTGWTRDETTLPRRVSHHRKGSGARLLQVVAAAGIGFKVVRTWPDGDRNKERRLKRSGGASRYCPVCRTRH
jgi:predicted GIY-YIG superfamily endonuclease